MTRRLPLLRWLEALLLERGTATRCLLFAGLSLLPLVVLWSLQAYALSSPAVMVHYQSGLLRGAQAMLSTMIVWLLVVMVYGWRAQHSERSLEGLALLTVTATFINLLLLSWGYGFKDTPMGMLLVVQLVLARALFPLRVVKFGLWAEVVVVLAAEVSHRQGWVGYAPLLSAPVFSGVDMAAWWMLWLRVVFAVAAVHFALMLFFFFDTLNRRSKELESLVRTDALTGLVNRREFMAELAAESHRHQRSGLPFCLLMCDLDHFKKVNDTWGHPMGDEVLAELGHILVSHTRDQIDIAARVGGEEFVVLLPETDLAGGQQVAQKISEALRQHVFRSGADTFVVTQSIGIAQVQGGQGEQALRVADQNLYEAKRAGRDRMVASVADLV
ncbi:MAG: GGDEF domain-containing protein [Pseudomonadota bacterium]